jgi:hypothetical protein
MSWSSSLGRASPSLTLGGIPVFSRQPSASGSPGDSSSREGRNTMIYDSLDQALIILMVSVAALTAFVIMPLGQFSQKARDWLRRWLLLPCLVLCGLIAVLLGIKALLSYQRGWRGYAVVPPANQSYTVWSAPSEDDARPIGALSPNETVVVGSQTGEWTRVSTRSGEEGWVELTFSTTDQLAFWMGKLLPAIPSLLFAVLILLYATRRRRKRR